MPANQKYLSSPGQRVLKVTAALVGGYLVAATFQLFLVSVLPIKKEVLVTNHFLTFLIWCTLMVVAFLAKNGWKIWGLYLLASVVFFSPYLYAMITKTPAP